MRLFVFAVVLVGAWGCSVQKPAVVPPPVDAGVEEPNQPYQFDLDLCMNEAQIRVVPPETLCPIIYSPP